MIIINYYFTIFNHFIYIIIFLDAKTKFFLKIISKNYLEQLLNNLRKNGIVSSIKGIKGGYYLSKALDEITLFDIFNSLENEFNLVSLELENNSYDIFFKEYNEKLKELFMQPLSSIKIDQEQAGKYLNYII